MKKLLVYMLLVFTSVTGLVFGAPPSTQGISRGQADALYAPIGTGVLVSAPSTFPGITQPVRIYRQPGGTFSTDFDPSKNKNALGSAAPGTGIYYVSPSGNSGNTGETLGSPLTIDAALAKSDVVELRFGAGEIRRTSASTVISKSINFVAVERGVKWTGWNADLTWSLLSGNIYQATRSTVQLVADGAPGVVDWAGRKAVYKYMGASDTPASIVVAPGQWATNVAASTVYVWPADSRVMTGTDTNIRLSINAGGTCLNIQGGVNVYAEGIDFEGGGSVTGGGRAMVQVSSTAGGNPTFTAYNCSASYSADNGFGSTGGSWISLVNCVAYGNTDDGFGYHYSATYSAVPTVLEIGCRSFNNGYDYQTTTQSVDDNRNGFTIHDGIDVIRVNCLASGSYGPNFADTGTGSSSWNLNCTSRAARGPTRGYGFHALDSAAVNTDSCTSLQNLLGQFRAEGSATITDSNSVAFGTNLWDNNSGAGTIAASAVAPISMRGSFDDQQRVLPVAVETSVAQSYTLNGSTRQITATGGALVVVSGSTASTTVLLPANPVLNQRFAIVNPSTVAWTLSGNGFNIDGASTQTMVAGIGRTVVWTGTEWRSPALTLAQLLANANTFSAVNIFSTTTVFGGTAQLQGVFRGRGQQFSGAGTIVSANGFQIEKTGSGAYTLALPTSPTQWDTYRIFDGYGDAGTNNLSVSSSDKAINGTAAGGGAVAAVNTNYGGAWITYDGTKWILSK